MDMRRHTRRWLNDTALASEFDGTFEGVIAAVTEEQVRNRFTAQRELQPVIAFAEGGWRVVPNLGMRTALIEMLGPETDQWIGRRISIHRRRVERADKATGEIRSSWQKVVSVPDRHARVLPMRRPVADYDDSAAPSEAEIFGEVEGGGR
jgi:hypothetical protein